MATSKLIIDKSKIDEYRSEFAQYKSVFFPRLIEPNFPQLFLNKMETLNFSDKVEQEARYKFGQIHFASADQPAVQIFNMLMNGKEWFHFLEEISACGTINDFVGRIHRSEGNESHGIGWHGDNVDKRLLAITLCLGNDKYTGAKFQLRAKGSEDLYRDIGQMEAGDAIVFQIHPNLVHRLSPIESGRRTVGVGWFRA